MPHKGYKEKGKEAVMILKKAISADFDLIYSEMERNFVPEELREYDFAREAMEHPAFTVYHIEENGDRVGFMTVWELEGFAYLEHFAVYDKYKNQGLGSRALGLLKDRCERIVLEAEPPEDELKARRIAFYERNGFYANDHFYLQPPYRRADEERVRLVLMSCPAPLEDCGAAADTIYNGILHKGKKG